jgi:hypothetical protein
VEPPPAAPGEAPESEVAVPTAEALLARVEASGGRLLVVDRTTEPQLVLDLDVEQASARDVRLPDLALGTFVVQGAGRDFGTLQVAGSTVDGRRDLDVFAQALPLAATAPYLERAGLPYWFVGGTGALVAQVALDGDRWSAETKLTLYEPRFGGDAAALGRSLGMPVEAALGALRDPAGDVTLSLPLASPRGEHAAALDGMVATALREAVARARQGPLPDAPILIAFPPGGTEIGIGAVRQLAAIADVLASRRDVVVELGSTISSDDRRWLAEQAAVAYLEEPDGLMGVLHALGVRDQHARIRDALAARRAGYPGRLDADDEAVLRELAAAAPVDEHRLAALAANRLRRVADALAEGHAIARTRVVVTDPGRHETASPPVVQARIDVGTPSLRSARRPGAERW